ncbi:MAG: FAD-binding oxidoreductase [Methylococcaceae bacterium]
MTRIKFDEQTFETENAETVLHTLLRNNVQVPYGCKAGVCQSCLMRSLDNAPPEKSQVGLKDPQQKQNYFLACLCKPEKDMTITLPNTESVWLEAEVIEKKNLSTNVIFLKLKSKEPLAFFAGQFVNLRRDDGVIRSYSIANIHNGEHELEFHIRILRNGQFSRWVADELEIGMSLSFSHAQGNCHYVERQTEQPLLLIGTGTGLAPLYGIIRDALSHKHQGEIHLFHGSRDASGLYLEKKLIALTQQYPNFHYTPCLSGSDISEKYTQGRANQIALEKFPKLNGWRVYLCGQPEMVLHSKRAAYLQGASLKDISADAFAY